MIKNLRTLAAIDIGTNAMRLLIKYADMVDSLPEYKKAAYIRVPIRLGEDVFTSGSISSEKEKLLSEAMQGFAHLMRAYEVDSFRACATSAMREAANGREIIKAIKKASGLKTEIISGEEEANLIFRAGEFDSLTDREKIYVYMDVGGGSTEIVVYSDHKPVFSESFRLGTVRMLSNAVDRDEPARFVDQLKRIAKQYAPVAIIGSGGNINKIAKLLGKKENQPVRKNEIQKLYEELSGISFEQRMEDFCLNSYRADVIVPALYLFYTAASLLEVENVIVPKVGLVDGIIRGLYENCGEKKKLPLPKKTSRKSRS